MRDFSELVSDSLDVDDDLRLETSASKEARVFSEEG